MDGNGKSGRNVVVFGPTSLFFSENLSNFKSKVLEMLKLPYVCAALTTQHLCFLCVLSSVKMKVNKEKGKFGSQGSVEKSTY